MSRYRFAKITTPAAASPTYVDLYVDSTDGRAKQIDESGVVRTLAAAEGRNMLINGGFEYAQRQVPTTITTYSNVGGRSYGFDRMWTSNENASIDLVATDTMTTPETNLQARFYGRIRKITALGKFAIGQTILGSSTGALRGRVVRVQAKMKYNPNPMTVRLGLIQLANAGTVDTVPITAGTFFSAWGAAGTDPTLGTNLAYIAPLLAESTGVIFGNALTCTLTAAWVRYSATFTVPANCKNITPVIWTNGQPAINDILQISEFGVYDGPDIVDWTPRLATDEVPILYRYYAKTFPVLTAPAQNAGVTTGALVQALGEAGATALAVRFHWRFPVPMVKTPTITLFNPAAANAQIRQVAGTAADLTASAAANTTDASTDITGTGAAGGAIGDYCMVHATADAEI